MKRQPPPIRTKRVASPQALQQALQVHPQIKAAIEALAEKISDDDMRHLNYAVDAQHRDVKEVVGEFLKKKGG